MSEADAYIARWEAAGLIDHPMAERLRAAETEAIAPPSMVAAGPAVPLPEMVAPTASAAVRPRSGASTMFGPGVTISELFGYLGGAFLVAAWSAFMARAVDATNDAEVVLGFMALIAAAAFTGLGLWLQGGGERASRASGVAFALVASYIGGAAAWLVLAAGADWPGVGVVASGTALAVAVVLRAIHPSVLTQVSVLSWLTALAVSMLAWIQEAFFAEDVSDYTGLPVGDGPDPLVLVIGSAAWWLATAVIIALIGLREARTGERDDDPAALRRAAVSRFWAGITAVIGLSLAVSRSAYLGNGDYGRVLEPWVGVVALLVLSAVLVERAYRRDATSFIYAAAFGLVIALSDLNLSYLSDSAEAALLIEGLILIGVGVAADRLRRQVGHIGQEPADGDAPDTPAADMT